jgi:hypothetical protein
MKLLWSSSPLAWILAIKYGWA